MIGPTVDRLSSSVATLRSTSSILFNLPPSHRKKLRKMRNFAPRHSPKPSTRHPILKTNQITHFANSDFALHTHPRAGHRQNSKFPKPHTFSAADAELRRNVVPLFSSFLTFASLGYPPIDGFAVPVHLMSVLRTSLLTPFEGFPPDSSSPSARPVYSPSPASQPSPSTPPRRTPTTPRRSDT